MSALVALVEGEAAVSPPEERGLRRDAVRLLVARPGRLAHTSFDRLCDHLRPGDVVVVNTSATRNGALDGTWRGRGVVVHFSTELDDGRWQVELRRPDGSGPVLEATEGERVTFEGGALTLEHPARQSGTRRMWTARVTVAGSVRRHLAERGRPVTYGYAPRRWPLERYQTVFARPDDPWGASAESPSAARPFTTTLVTRLVAAGVIVVPLTLHTGVSSLERGEMPLAEWFDVPEATAAAVEEARRRASRVVAVGTTATRALESAVDATGRVRPASGWTDLVLSPDRPATVVNALVTGWHPPDASHLLLLEAVAGPELVSDAYREAVEAGYLWHEFGDSCLLLP